MGGKLTDGLCYDWGLDWENDLDLESNQLNLFTKVSSQLYPRCLRVFAILRFSKVLLSTYCF